MFSCEFCEISKNTFSYRTPPVVASVLYTAKKTNQSISPIISYNLQARNQKFFRAGEVWWNQSTSINLPSKIQEKRAPFGVFSPRYSQNYILNGKFNLWMNTIRVFFCKIRALFFAFKKGQGSSSPPLPLNARLIYHLY